MALYNQRPAQNIDAFLATTSYNYYKSGIMHDCVSRANVVFDEIRKRGNIKYKDRGYQLDVNLMYGLNNTVQSYSRYGSFAIDPQDGMTTVFYPWAQYAGSVSLDGYSEWANAGKGRIVNLLDEKFEQLQISYAQLMNEHLMDVNVLSDTTRGNGNKNILSIPALVQADPTASLSIAGLNQSTATYWRNKYISSAATSMALLKREMIHLINLCKAVAPRTKPSILVSDITLHEDYMQSFDSQVRYKSGENADMIGDVPTVLGVPYYWDDCVPDAAAGVNYDSSSFTDSTLYALNLDHIKLMIGQGRDWVPGPWKSPVDQDARVQTWFLIAQLISSNRAKSGVLHGITQNLT